MRSQSRTRSAHAPEAAGVSGLQPHGSRDVIGRVGRDRCVSKEVVVGDVMVGEHHEARAGRETPWGRIPFRSSRRKSPELLERGRPLLVEDHGEVVNLRRSHVRDGDRPADARAEAVGRRAEGYAEVLGEWSLPLLERDIQPPRVTTKGRRQEQKLHEPHDS